jgi:hypothetical protein
MHLHSDRLYPPSITRAQASSVVRPPRQTLRSCFHFADFFRSATSRLTIAARTARTIPTARASQKVINLTSLAPSSRPDLLRLVRQQAPSDPVCSRQRTLAHADLREGRVAGLDETSRQPDRPTRDTPLRSGAIATRRTSAQSVRQDRRELMQQHERAKG